MSIADFIPEKFIGLFSDPDFSKAIKGYNLYLIKEDPEYKNEVKNLVNNELETSFDSHLITSELKPIQRLAEVESVTGLNDFSDFEEEHEPNLPEQITEIKEQISELKEQKISTPAPFELKNLVPETKTEKQAVCLFKYVHEELGERNGQFYINNSEFNEFIKSKICKYDPELKAKPLQNTRKLKIDLINVLTRIYTGLVSTDKQKHGWRSVRILFRPLQSVTS